MARYVLHPGFIWSKSDGQRHFIGAAQLAKLYNISLSDCVVRPYTTHVDTERLHDKIYAYPEATHLHPDYHGRYILPEPNHEPI